MKPSYIPLRDPSLLPSVVKRRFPHYLLDESLPVLLLPHMADDPPHSCSSLLLLPQSLYCPLYMLLLLTAYHHFGAIPEQTMSYCIPDAGKRRKSREGGYQYV